MNPEAQNSVTVDPSDNATLTEVVDGYRSAGYDGDFFAEGTRACVAAVASR